MVVAEVTEEGSSSASGLYSGILAHGFPFVFLADRRQRPLNSNIRRLHRTMRAPILALLGILSVQPALAAPAESSKPAPRQLLSRAEVRACFLREIELDRRRVALREAQETHRPTGSTLLAEALELSQILRTLNNADEAAVDSYNKRNDARNLEVDAYNKRSDALNASADELQVAEADYLAACAARPFLKADEDIVLKELGLKQRPSRRNHAATTPGPKPLALPATSQPQN